MKHQITSVILIGLLGFVTSSVLAQKGNRHYAGNDAAQYYKGASQVLVSNDRNTISFIRLKDDQSITVQEAPDWLRNDVLKPAADVQLNLNRKLSDKVGYTHLRYKEYYKGIPVEYGVYYVHTKDGVVKSANGEWYNIGNVSTHPSLTPDQAYQRALGYVNAQLWWHEREDADNNKLMILPADGSYKLVYRCDVYARQPWTRDYVYVDAINGDLVKKISRMDNTDVYGTAQTAYCGVKTIVSDSISPTLFTLHDYTRGAGVETYNVSEPNDFTSTSKNWDYNGGFDMYALDAHFGAEATYDWYANNYAWYSVDGAGQQILKSLVHTGPGINAFWDGTYMSYLDGDASLGVTPLTSLDVCGHELTHGVTEHSSGLIYSCESGSLNESLSDMFGITIRFENIPNGTWVLGDQFNYVIRNMANPNDQANPKCYQGLYWTPCPEVHSGSGVGNFWYYLLTEGGSGVNDLGNAYQVMGIGLLEANAIAFRVNTVYLTPNSGYLDFGDLVVQAAKDLYGDCSNEAIQTANALYAVGIGNGFADAVTALFVADQTHFCSFPATVNFTNNSFNATDYFWDFGDGTTSTDQNPVHVYNDTGTYSVTLIVNGVSLCNTSDTLVQTAYINVQNVGQPVPAVCIPTDTTPNMNYGITHFVLAGIDRSSGSALEGYRDFTCSDFTSLTAGDPYTAQITVGNNGDDLRMWIDYSNDGIFDSTELVYSAYDVSGTVSSLFYTPQNAVLNTPLRLRIIDDRKSATITTDGCFNPERGQAEDYGVYFVAPPAVPPVVDFVASDTSINMGQAINFNDLSTNSPTVWNWQFNGGIPATSVLQNPTNITYPNPGTYDVTLTATNAYGGDTLTKTGYIVVNPVITLCSVDTITLDAGTFYDSGGSAGNYQNNENCTLLIQPACAKDITLAFTSFATSSGDVLNVYDGPDANAPLLLSLSGYPFPLPSVTGTASSMFIQWTSSPGTTNSGFGANWTSTVGGLVTPVAGFSVSDPNPPYNIPVDFTDLSTNTPIDWSWDLGDGTTTADQNTTHAYTTSGPMTVSLIASNCGGADTTSQIVDVQQPPIMAVSPSSIDVNLSCANSFSYEASVSNHGAGDLVYDVSEFEYNMQGSQPEILAINTGVNTGKYNNTISAMNTYFPGYTITTTTTENADTLAMLLQGKNTVLIAGISGNPNVFSNFAAPLSEFVNNGGTVIFTGTNAATSPCMYNTGLVTGAYASTAQNTSLDVVNLSHPITQGLPALIANNPKHCYAHAFTNGMNDLITYNGNTVVGYVDEGYGHVVYIGFDYYQANDTASLVIGNTLSWINSMLVSDFVTMTPAGGGTLGPAQTQQYTITVTNTGLPDGTYTEYFVVSGNDPNNPVDTIFINITVGSGDCITSSADVQCFGSVCFDDSVQGGASSIHWDFGDGNSADVEDPCHVYTQSGTYNVTMIACGYFGCDTIYSTVDVSIVSASLAYTGNLFVNDTLSFFSNTQNAASVSWDFGDGNSSTLNDPQHVYTSPGSYIVVLTVTDSSGCYITLSDTLNILTTGIASVESEFKVSLYPNPTHSQSVLQYTLPAAATVLIELWNGIGQKQSTPVDEKSQSAGVHSVTINLDGAGVYYLKLQIGDELLWKKLVNVK